MIFRALYRSFNLSQQVLSTAYFDDFHGCDFMELDLRDPYSDGSSDDACVLSTASDDNVGYTYGHQVSGDKITAWRLLVSCDGDILGAKENASHADQNESGYIVAHFLDGTSHTFPKNEKALAASKKGPKDPKKTKEGE